MTKNCDDTFLTQHNGTSQADRILSALDPQQLELQNITVEDWVVLANNFAQYVMYFDEADAKNPSGDWQKFFSIAEVDTVKTFIADAEKNKDLTPHLTLFITFLKLLDLSKTRFNTLTEKHLDFYYQEILQIPHKAAVADKAHLIIELAKNINETAIDAETAYNGGKDTIGKIREYNNHELTTINKAQVSQIKSILHHKNDDNGKLKIANSTNSFDGEGAELKENKSWWPFGYSSTYDGRPELKDATLGFAIAAPVLRLQEGEREILIDLTFQNAVTTINIGDILEHLQVFLTGDKGWIGPLTLTNETDSGLKTQINDSKLSLALSLDKNVKPIVDYNSELHEGQFNAGKPIIKTVLNTAEKEAYDLYAELQKLKLINTNVVTVVSEISALKLENDIGTINPEKPFYPFGTRPFKGSNFRVNYDEMFKKKWSLLNLNFKWLNTPDDFRDLYFAYRSDKFKSYSEFKKNIYTASTTNVKDLIQNSLTLEDEGQLKDLFEKLDLEKLSFDSGNFTLNNNPINLIVKDANHFKATAKVESDNGNDSSVSFALFNANEENYNATLSYVNNKTKPGEAALELSLQQSFYHEMYPRIYSLAIANNTESTIIPNEPYTPFLEAVTLQYVASQNLNNLTQKQDDGIENLELYHIHPFGFSSASQTIFPAYAEGGEMFIALEDAQPLQKVSMLFQLLVGTENTESPTFTGDERIQWEILTATGWNDITKTNIAQDSTGNFLKTGIVAVNIPQEAVTDNPLMPLGFIWLKAKMNKAYDSVSRFIDIKTQVVLTEFEDNGNSLAHLKTGLPAKTISKPIIRKAEIKSITQPYSSFGGKPEEDAASYRRRVSERLRHKDRAVSQWDYEHLILQAFPEIYKAKCLNHTCCSFKSPGKVTVVVIPDIVNQNVYDVFEPRVSQAKLNEIATFLNDRTSFFVTPQVKNPDYEEVKVSLDVKFKTGLDENYHRELLREDIKKYLSPWAFEETSSIVFGVSLHKSHFIKHLEDLDYVDYLENVIMQHDGEQKNQIIPSNPKAILVSSKQHIVNIAKDPCETATSTVSKATC